MRNQIIDRGIAGGVGSAGTMAEGHPASDLAVEAMQRRGLDITGHRSRLVDQGMIDTADLIVGMARVHVRETVLIEPGSYGRTFTLKELVRRGAAVGPRGSGEALGDWLARVHEGRVATELLGASEVDDIMDPIGMRKGVYERVADEISGLVESLAGLLWMNATDNLETGGPR